MPFTSYSGYVNEILSWAQPSSTMTTAQVTSLIGVSERQVNQKLRVRPMETALAATVVTAGTAAVPADYMELKYAYIAGTPTRPLKRSTPDAIYAKYPDRTPLALQESLVAREGSSFIFGPAGQSGDVMTGIYYANPISMADNTTVTQTFSLYPQVYLYAALSNLEPFIGRDPRIQVWANYYLKALEDANGQDARESASGGSLQAQVT